MIPPITYLTLRIVKICRRKRVFATAEIALRSLQDMSIHKEPDIILLDPNLPGISGLEAQPFFMKTLPDTEIIILTQSDKKAEILRSFNSEPKIIS